MVIQLRFGTEEYKKAKTELKSLQDQLSPLTKQKESCEANKNLQVQEYNDAAAYDIEYATAEENVNSADTEITQLNADMEKLEQSVIKNKKGEIASYKDADGNKISNNDRATAEYNQQKSLIQQKLEIAVKNKETAAQEKERINQERSQKQLKETEIEKKEAEEAEKFLDELNTQINGLNEKITPLEEAITIADEDRVDVAAQNNKSWEFYAEKELKAENPNANPTPAEIASRAEEIKQRNIELGNCDKEGNLIVGKTIVTLTGKSGGVADGMKSVDEAVNQYSSAINNKAAKIVENALGQLSTEEKAAYNSLSSEQKLAIQNQISESINKGKADNASALIKQAISNVISNPNTPQNEQQTSTNTVPFVLSLDNTMLSNGYIKTPDGNYQKGDKLYKASGDMTSGVTITEIGNAPVKKLSQEQMDISQKLNACRTDANATLAKANQVIKYSSASGMLNGLMHAEYHNICDKNTNLIFEVAKLGGYDSPNISNQISIVNRLSKELDSLCDAYIAKDKGMSDSFYNTLDKAGLVPGLSVATASVSAIGKAFDEKHSEDGLTLAETGKIVTEFCFNAFAGKLLSKIPGFDKFANTLAKKAFNYCGNNITKTKIFEFMQNYGLSELSSLIASSDS